MKVICMNVISILAVRKTWQILAFAYLQPILQLSYHWTFRYESEDLPLDGEGKRDDEGHKDGHLEDEKEENLNK